MAAPRSMAFAIRSNRTGTESFLRQIQEDAALSIVQY
jgi:hypothetical protein